MVANFILQEEPPMRTPTPLILSTCTLAFAVFGLAACGGGDASLEEASATVERVARDVEIARDLVEQREGEVKEAMENLEGARQDLASIETELAEARKNVEEAVSDNDLFRAVQSALLADRDLEEHAIAARVAQRVVTLEGSVPTDELKGRAEKIAGEALGVATVVNQIRVAPPAEG
jgi:osmotically-inducible protein OsmY